jgi:hypothetical protein
MYLEVLKLLRSRRQVVHIFLDEEIRMDTFCDDLYGVFVRVDRGQIYYPQSLEQILTTCGSYAEARDIQREYAGMGRCVIRYLGDLAGGGD